MQPHIISPDILRRLRRGVDDFLPRWTNRMGNAGYLESTTAKREDCILSYRWFLEPLLTAAEAGDLPDFGDLIQNRDDWAGKILDTSRRHRSRGITGEMFVGCFKTLVHAVLEVAHQGPESREEKAAAERFIRLWADALETLIVRDWTTLSMKESADSLDLANRELTMEKCKYENVLDSISDLVLVIDISGRVLEVNRAARQFFGKDPTDTPVLELLGMEGQSLEALYAVYTPEAPLEISPDSSRHFHCGFIPLNQVSLSSDGYLVILKDVTVHVKQSEILEAIVTQRTSELLKKKDQLQEMNVTLRTVMKSVDKERLDFQKSVGDTIQKALLPALAPVRKESSKSVRNAYLDIVEDQLVKLARGGGREDRALLLKMTPSEMKICRFIQAGASTKEIADTLNLSMETVQTHRRNIRRKLNLQNRRVNLATFLNQAGTTD